MRFVANKSTRSFKILAVSFLSNRIMLTELLMLSFYKIINDAF